MEGEDLISKLPDALLADIVSLLLSAEGVRTSVLSQRWKTLWKHSHLNFDQKQMSKPLIEHYLQYTNPNKRFASASRRKVASRGRKSMDAISKASKMINSVIDARCSPLKSCRIRHLAESCVSGEAVGWMKKLLGKWVREISMERENHYDLNPYYQDMEYAWKDLGLTLDLPFELFSGFEVNDDLENHNVGVYDQNEDDSLPFPKLLFWQRRELCECINHQLKTLYLKGFTVIATVCFPSYPKASTNLSIILKPGKKYMERVGGSFEEWVSTLRLK
ncbi:Leucine-rich repeat domain superfamily [Sesbania bispinosa]|nr:Leucine-rich repeat domain superfamily [Sesbania bispinosa]